MTTTHRLGWMLFIVSAVFFGISGLRAGDWFTVGGSIVFGTGCVLFLIPGRR